MEYLFIGYMKVICLLRYLYQINLKKKLKQFKNWEFGHNSKQEYLGTYKKKKK